MKSATCSNATRWAQRCAVALLALAVAGPLARGQETPLITGSIGFLHGTNRGQTSYLPAFMPLAVVPVKQRLLFETRGLFTESITPRAGKSYQTRFGRNLNYLQLDYIANRHMTIVAGKFLTPFGTYNERLSPLWIANFQDGPLIFSLGSNQSAGVGGQVRGSAFANNTVAVDYATFFQANVGGTQFKSSRATGGRLNFYFPASGFEFGTSYDHMFEGQHPNAAGMHVWWTPHNVPMRFRSEFARSTHTKGYWFEVGYRLARSTSSEDSWIGRLQPLFRMQQTFRNSADGTDGAPGVDEKRVDFGLDYYLPHEARINTSYTRQIAIGATGNIWKTELVYRFAFPAWPGRSR